MTVVSSVIHQRENGCQLIHEQFHIGCRAEVALDMEMIEHYTTRRNTDTILDGYTRKDGEEYYRISRGIEYYALINRYLENVLTAVLVEFSFRSHSLRNYGINELWVLYSELTYARVATEMRVGGGNACLSTARQAFNVEPVVNVSSTSRT